MQFSQVMNRATFIMPPSDIPNKHSIMHRRNHPVEHREATSKKKEESLETTTILIAPIHIHHSHFHLLFACYRAPTPPWRKSCYCHPILHSIRPSPVEPTTELYLSYLHPPAAKAVAPLPPRQFIMPTYRTDKSNDLIDVFIRYSFRRSSPRIFNTYLSVLVEDGPSIGSL